MGKENLAIVSNEKTYINNQNYFCDNIDMKSIPEGLNKNFDIELFVRGEGSSVAGASKCSSRNNEKDVEIIEGDCGSGACCNLNTCNYKSSGSQPTDYDDEY